MQWQEQLRRDGDDSQLICCDHVADMEHKWLNDDDVKDIKSVIIGKKRSFISVEDFNKEVLKKKPKSAIKWADLPIGDIFKIIDIKKIDIVRDGVKKVAHIAVLEDTEEVKTDVWLTSLIEKKLKGIDVEKKSIYIRSLGLRNSVKNTGRRYYDFEMV